MHPRTVPAACFAAKCNTGLGCFDDDPLFLRRAADVPGRRRAAFAPHPRFPLSWQAWPGLADRRGHSTPARSRRVAPGPHYLPPPGPPFRPCKPADQQADSGPGPRLGQRPGLCQAAPICAAPLVPLPIRPREPADGKLKPGSRPGSPLAGPTARRIRCPPPVMINTFLSQEAMATPSPNSPHPFRDPGAHLGFAPRPAGAQLNVWHGPSPQRLFFFSAGAFIARQHHQRNDPPERQDATAPWVGELARQAPPPVIPQPPRHRETRRDDRVRRPLVQATPDPGVPRRGLCAAPAPAVPPSRRPCPPPGPTGQPISTSPIRCHLSQRNFLGVAGRCSGLQSRFPHPPATVTCAAIRTDPGLVRQQRERHAAATSAPVRADPSQTAREPPTAPDGGFHI